jgi:hypothetical protein
MPIAISIKDLFANLRELNFQSHPSYIHFTKHRLLTVSRLRSNRYTQIRGDCCI